MIDGLRATDKVIISCDGEKYMAVVSLISPNGRSLVLNFEAMIDGHVGMMPVSADDGGNYFALLTGKPLTLARPS